MIAYCDAHDILQLNLQAMPANSAALALYTKKGFTLVKQTKILTLVRKPLN